MHSSSWASRELQYYDPCFCKDGKYEHTSHSRHRQIRKVIVRVEVYVSTGKLRQG